jgi:cyclic pyranopterin phosphate synthase
VESIIRVASKLGIKNVKLTGGEPLLREDIVEIVSRIKPYMEEVSMTTNASKLKEKACKLKEAGLARVNISLHSLNPSKFMDITGRDHVDKVEAGIREAIKCELAPVKLNMVVIKGVNHDEIDNLINFSSRTGAVLQLIEFQELENGIEYYDKLHYNLVPVEEMLLKRSEKVVKREMHLRKIYYLKNGAQVEVVRPMHNTTFCAYCTRLRVTSDGKLKACLMRDDNHVPLVSLIRKGEPQEALLEAFTEAVNRREPYWRE